MVLTNAAAWAWPWRVLNSKTMERNRQAPQRSLITGVAGSGKSTLEKEFKQRGYITIDIDDGYAEWRHAVTNELLLYTPNEPGWHEVAEWVVETDKLQAFFDANASHPVYVFGSFARMSRVVGLFDTIYLLKYRDEAMLRERIAGREGGYGKHKSELERILSYIQPYQTKMQKYGAVAIDCGLPIEQIAKVIIG